MAALDWEELHGRDRVAEVVRTSTTASEALRRLGLRAAGGNFRTLARWCERWGLDRSHFDPHATRRSGLLRPEARPLAEVLVAGSTYSRAQLKRRLYAEGLKAPRCELCGQGDVWRGRPMALVLDHVNGVADDHRLENLRIVCPNCNATLETHCGRHRRVSRRCERCAGEFHPRRPEQRFCGWRCAQDAQRGPQDPQRRVERPPEAQLRAEVAASGFRAVGRRYGVSDNAIRKWLRAYERERAPVPAGRDGPDTRRD